MSMKFWVVALADSNVLILGPFLHGGTILDFFGQHYPFSLGCAAEWADVSRRWTGANLD